jgi:hypothetical protein
MATTTPNFGWPVPTSTDLVKDGATAIEALGDSIDASLLDLKGGTTGQVLAKTTNTDMDFTWVTDAGGDITGVTAGTGISGGGTSGTVTVTNSMATAIDAKGDLVPGTGADTFARLAVGANDTILTAASGEATGLKWAGGWQTWTPTFGGTMVKGNGTVVSRYAQIGKTLTFQFSFTLGSTSVIGASAYFSVPLAPVTTTPIIGYFLDAGTAEYAGYSIVNTAGNVELKLLPSGGTYLAVANVSATTPFTWTTNDLIYYTGTYEVA